MKETKCNKENIGKYRIKEYQNFFYVQLYTYRDVGSLWWKKRIWRWYPANCCGTIYEDYTYYSPLYAPTLEQAKKYIETFTSKTKYHYINE